jgi:tetratricopeptide (TPR) repeat protein
MKRYINSIVEKYHRNRGLKLLRLSMYKKAFHHFEKALSLDDSMINYFYFSICLISMNKHRSAIKYLEKIFDAHKDDILISTTLAECYLVVRDWCKADDLLGFLTDTHKDNIFIRKLWTISHDVVLREKYAASKEYFYHASEYLDIKDYDSSYSKIKQAIDLDDSNSTYYFLAGLILIQGKKPKIEIEQYLERAVFLSPNNVSYKKKLHWLKTRYKVV